MKHVKRFGDHIHAHMNRELQASFVIETAAIFPVIFLVFTVSVYLFFYYHDKMIITGAAYETAVIGSEKMRLLHKPDGEQLEQYFQKRIRGKMIFFAGSSAHVWVNESEVRVEAEAYRRHMHIRVVGSMKVTEPEAYLRTGKKLRKAVDQ